MFKAQRFSSHQKLFTAFWTPFQQKSLPLTSAGTPNVKPLVAMLNSTTDGDLFTCMWNGHYGDQQLVLNYFEKLLTGFDIVSSELRPAADKPSATGQFQLVHTRPFLGEWAPTGQHLTYTFRVSLEPHGDLINHVCFKCTLPETLVEHGCPAELAQAMEKPLVLPSTVRSSRTLLQGIEGVPEGKILSAV